MSLIAVIGDIHGCIYTLKELYPKLKQNTTEIYSVGDLVDRGANSKEVIQFCIDEGIKCVLGNHEDIILRVHGVVSDAPHITPEKRLENHIVNGGDATIKSYTGSRKIDVKKYREELEETGHMEFIKNLPEKIELDGVIITHAGITDETDDVIWHRKIPSKQEKFQVFGHTPLKDVDYNEGWYANIDTGCFYKNYGYGHLTGVILDKKTGNVSEFITVENKKDTMIS